MVASASKYSNSIKFNIHMVKKIIYLLFFFSIHFSNVWGQISKVNPQNDKFFITKGDTIWYHSKYTWFDSDVDWLMNERSHLYALVDSNLNVLTEFRYKMVYPFYRNRDCAVAMRDGRWGVLNKNGKDIIEFKYTSVPYHCLDTTMNKEFFIISQKSKKGVVDISGKTIIPLKWDEIFYYNYATLNLIKRKKSYLYLMKSCKIMPLKNNCLLYRFNEHGKTVLWNSKLDKFGVIDTSGTIIQPCIYNREKDVEKFLK